MTVNEIITERIIAQLEKGVAPWNKPWKLREQMPRNLISGKPYRGMNVLLLHMAAYESPFWLTYKQAEEKHAQVRKGEKSTPIIFWGKTKYTDPQTKLEKDSFVLRYYSVFNLAQIDGINPAMVPTIMATPPTPAEQIVAGMPDRPAIKYGFRVCSYCPNTDEINMVEKNCFNAQEDHDSTLFHELIHSTGHKSRLGRLENKRVRFGNEDYSKEELCAEIGAAFLCGEAGILTRTVNNTASYLANWLTALKNDKTLIITAAGQAQKAADYILNRTHATPTTED